MRITLCNYKYRSECKGKNIMGRKRKKNTTGKNTKIQPLITLTHDLEKEEYTGRWMGRHLALVHTAVPWLYVLYLEAPILAVMKVYRLKPLVTRIRRQTNGQ